MVGAFVARYSGGTVRALHPIPYSPLAVARGTLPIEAKPLHIVVSKKNYAICGGFRRKWQGEIRGKSPQICYAGPQIAATLARPQMGPTGQAIYTSIVEFPRSIRVITLRAVKIPLAKFGKMGHI